MKELRFEPTTDCSTLVEILRWRAQHQPERRAYTFLVDGETVEASLIYKELDRGARAIAAKLQSLGAQGMRALLLYPAGLEFITAFMGCLYSGTIAVPVYPPHPARLDRNMPRIVGIANDAKPTLALTTSSIMVHSEVFFNWAPELREMQWLATDKIPQELADNWQEPEIVSSTSAFFQYTSGSTTAPRGVVLSHSNLLHNERMMQHAMEQTANSIVVGWLPLYHDMGLIGNVLQPLFVGCPCILMSPVIFLQRPLRWLQAISRFRATTSGGPNFAFDLCVQKITIEQRALLDLSSWDLAFIGAEPINHKTLDQFAEYFEPCGFRPEALYPCYGLAEATLFVSGGSKADRHIVFNSRPSPVKQEQPTGKAVESDGNHRLVGCGRTVMDQEIVIVDPHSLTRCSPGREGEIWVSGPNVARGYWNGQDETKRVFRAHLVDTGEGPFLRTGDLGFFKDGELFVTGRLKDLIIIDGSNHYPQDIEWTVERSHKSLRTSCCAAFPINLADREQLVIAAEVDPRYLPKHTRQSKDITPGRNLKHRAPLDFKEIVRTIRKTVALHHDLQVYDIILLKAGSIPKTSSGKIQRHACKARYLAGSLEVLEG
jgi:acyl-CoA synthetase (AMP-forming)/AMP-acid ligase II